MQASDRQSRYYAYVLRLWVQQSKSSDDLGDWRCSLEDPHTGARRGFAGLAALIAFLQDELMRPLWTAEPDDQMIVPDPPMGTLDARDAPSLDDGGSSHNA